MALIRETLLPFILSTQEESESLSQHLISSGSELNKLNHGHIGVAAASNENNTPLLLIQTAPSHPLKRTGTVWTAVAHIVRGVIGSGVLSLAWSIGQLGWLAGPLSILIIASTTLMISSLLLSNTYRSPDPEFGRSAS